MQTRAMQTQPDTPLRHLRDKVELTDVERALIRRSAERAGYLTWVEFYNGPRGGRFRPVRGPVSVTEVGASRHYDELTGRRWVQTIRTAAIVKVDALGVVLDVLS